MKSGGQGGSSSSFLQIVNQLNEGAMQSLRKFDFSDAANLFKNALDILVENFGRTDKRCVNTYYKYGLALLYGVQIPEKDPMAAVPKEIHYLLGIDGSVLLRPLKSVHKEKQKDEMQIYEELQVAREQLNNAWSIVIKDEPANSIQKVNILSALGEVAFRQGEIDCYYLYVDAIQMLKELIEPDNQRVAHLITADAIKYCEEAISVARTRLRRLIAEVESALRSQATLTQKREQNNDPLIQRKRAETLKLVHLSNYFQTKLDELRKAPMFKASTDQAGPSQKPSPQTN